MPFPPPTTFLETVAAALLGIAILFASLSLFSAVRTVAVRMCAILSLAALAIFANHWLTYFSAIFIIATAVTELEFLHILAAIARGDKNYFDFRREFLTREEALLKSRQDANVDGESTDATTSSPEALVAPPQVKLIAVPKHGVVPSSTSLLIEERALDWFERTFGLSLQRYVRFLSTDAAIEVDGVALAANRRGRDTVVEVKVLRRAHGIMLRTLAERFATLAKKYAAVTGRSAEFVLLLVAPTRDAISDQLLVRILKDVGADGVSHKVLVVPYTDLDLALVEPEGVVDTAG